MPTDELEPRHQILVVDDEAGIRDLILAYFSSIQMSAVGAEDGPGAIFALERSRGRYDIVVTDLNLPGADGFAVLHAARQANPNCYVIIVTGYASLDSAIQAVRVGAYDYLTKPFSLGQLDLVIRRIRQHAEGGRQHRQPSTLGPAPPLPPSHVTLEARVTALESSLARLEGILDQPPRSTPSRLRGVGTPTLLTLSPRPPKV